MTSDELIDLDADSDSDFRRSLLRSGVELGPRQIPLEFPRGDCFRLGHADKRRLVWLWWELGVSTRVLLSLRNLVKGKLSPF